jgi:hypothetical protein
LTYSERCLKSDLILVEAKKAAAKKSNSNDDVGGCVQDVCCWLLLWSQAMAQAEGQVRSRPWLVSARRLLCELW